MTTIPPVVFQVGIWLTPIFYTTIASLYAIRRKRFPIRQRLPTFVLIEFFFFSIAGMEALIIGAYPNDPFFSNCKVFVILVTVCDHVPVMLLAYRFIFIFLKHFYTKLIIQRDLSNKRQFQSGSVQVAESRTEISFTAETLIAPNVQVAQQSRVINANFAKIMDEEGLSCAQKLVYIPVGFLARYMGIKYMASVFLIPSAMIAIADLMYSVSHPLSSQISLFQDECATIGGLNTSALLKFIALIPLLYYLGVAFGVFVRLHDNFKLGREFRILLVLNMFLVYFTVNNAILQSWKILFVDLKIWSLLVGWMIIPAEFVVQGLLPIVMSYRINARIKQMSNNTAKFIKKQDIKSALLTAEETSFTSGATSSTEKSRAYVSSEFEDVIASAIGRQAFLEFLEKEFAVENLLFFESVAAFRERFQSANNELSPEGEQEAHQIYETFIKTSSPSCVNISYEVRQRIIDIYENTRTSKTLTPAQRVPTPDMFDSAQKEIFRLITRDSFLRFKLSPKFCELTSTLNLL
jgi:hypothetical protein